MDLKNLISKEIFCKPDFKGSFFIHSQPDFEGQSIEIKPNDLIGTVKTFVKSKTIPGQSFIVVSRKNQFYYCNLDFLKNIYFSNLKGSTPEIVAKQTYTTLYLGIAAALALFFIARKK